MNLERPDANQGVNERSLVPKETVHTEMTEYLNEMFGVFDKNMINSVLDTLQDRYPGVSRHDLEAAFVREVQSLTKEEQVQLKNLTIKMIGVPHSAEAIPVLRPRLESTIETIDFVVLERGVQVADPAYARLEKINYNPGAVFFFQIEEMAKTHQKGIILTDPGYTYEGTEEQQWDYQEQLLNLDKSLQQYLGESGAIATTAGLVATAAVATQTVKKKSINRRDFLKFGAGVALTGSGLGTIGIVKNNEDHVSLALAPDERLAVYNFFDYRDVVVAEGLDNFAQSLPQPASATLIFGVGHIDGIKYYLENPKVRAAKLAAYKPFADKSKAIFSINQFACDEGVSVEEAKAAGWGEWREVERHVIF